MSFDKDINETIASAVNAKIEGAVLQALTSDGTIAAYVSAALNEKVGDRYRQDTFINELIKNTVREKTRQVVSEEIAAFEDAIKDEVRKALAESIGVITDSLVSGFVENTRGSYPRIEVKFGDQG